MDKLAPPSAENDFHQSHVIRLLTSYQRLLNQPLLVDNGQMPLARQVFEADFVLLSHTADSDPLFNYGNRKALTLFEFSWDELIGLPSRFSAEPINRQAREQLLAEVGRQGYIGNYSGVRIAKSGKRFLIERAVVWNINDQQGHYLGQAACFKDWIPLTA